MNKKAAYRYGLLVALMLVCIWAQSWILLLVLLLCCIVFLYTPAYKKFSSWQAQLSDKKKQWLSWLFSAFYAIIILFFINTYLFGIYTLQSSSMEPTYSTGDIFLMNKVEIGPGKAIDDINKYHRLRGWEKLQCGDVIVFHFPEADTVFVNNPKENYHFKKREIRIYGKSKTLIHNKIKFKPVHERPRFIKRIIALPGDTLEIRDGLYMVNNEVSHYNSLLMHQYILNHDTPLAIHHEIIKASHSSYSEEGQQIIEIQENILKKHNWTDYLKRKEMPLNMPDPYVFPFSTSSLWNTSFWGPAVVPQKNQTISINEHNLSLYWRIMETYEGNQVKLKDGTFFLNGQACSSYTFKMNYYWVAGDNRPHSFDSRYWGFVPENHIIGVLNKLPFSK